MEGFFLNDTVVTTRNINHDRHNISHVPSFSSSLFLLLHIWCSRHDEAIFVIFIFLLAMLTSSILMKYSFMKIKPISSRRALVSQPTLPPGPSPWPILGCIPEMWRNRLVSPWIHRLMKELDTDIACIRLGNTHVIPVTSPDIAREFLKKQDSIFASRPMTMATRMISRGYLTTALVPQGDQWKKMRRILASDVLSRSRLGRLLHKRNQEADNMVRFVYNQSTSNGGGLVNVTTVTQQYPTGVMRRMMFDQRYFGKGRDDGGPGQEEEEHFQAIVTLLLHIYAFSISDYLPWLKWMDLDGHQRIVCEAMKVINKYHDPIINERIRQWRKGMRTEHEDLLDVFISLKDSEGNPLLSEDEIRAQILVRLLFCL